VRCFFTQLTDIPTQLIGMVWARRTITARRYRNGQSGVGSLTTLTLLARRYGIVERDRLGTLALNGVIYAG
jgi:hypothetical protein